MPSIRIGVEEIEAMAKTEDGKRKTSYMSLKLTYKRKKGGSVSRRKAVARVANPSRDELDEPRSVV